ncbi:hypothetical protein F2P81_009028 [Scophthalmus maximus]|uniref:DH domain-containing protein n=1 Tax=Scophthalmus maximus TaxID=52904 RepID=A0A6A4T5R5_SCOMX|nr:hypothetical protein F2P81_009028 [Scophthalmus maximus]
MAESNPLRGFPRLRRAAVVMLRSVGELLRYIDENHLTSDFTAKVEYCQSDWVVLRTSIETFAVTVKEIAQLLQGFGSELSETDIPDEANAVEFLLHSHTHRYRQMKEDIRSVLKEGRLLLSNLDTVKASKRDAEEEREIQADMATVQRCSPSELFYSSSGKLIGHNKSSNEYIRLLTQLRDMEEAFDGFFEKHHLKLQQYTQLLQYEISFQQEEMARAQVVILHGHQLAANHHYALALIVQHCNELRHHCDIITAAIRTKRASLTRARDLLHRLEDIEVMHDYQGNRSCLYGSNPETDSEVEDNPEQVTRHIMKELIATERVYVDELLSVLLKEKFQVYERYCQNKSRSELLWRQCSDSPFFQECQKKLEHKLGLDSYLLKPVQRLAKYQLLLKELLRHRAEERYRCELQDALDSMLELLKSVNDSMHQIAITGYQGDLSQLGRVVLQGGFSVWISHKRAAVRMKELARFKPMQRHLFLYDHALLFCKRRDEDNHDRTPFYSFKSCLRMSAVGITENVKGDLKKFEIWYNGREVVYIVQTRLILYRSQATQFPTVAICEGLEDWAATDLSNLSDSEEEDQPAPLVAGRYRVMVESSMASTDDIIFNSGDVIQLLHEDSSGMCDFRLVPIKNSSSSSAAVITTVAMG